MSDLERILASMRQACLEADVGIVTGDTKVVEKGALGGCVMNVSGMGKRTAALEHNLRSCEEVPQGFRGTMDAGQQLASWRQNHAFRHHRRPRISGALGAGRAQSSAAKSNRDVKPLNKLIQRHAGRSRRRRSHERSHPRRLSRLRSTSRPKNPRTGILIQEDKVPIRDDVRAACEMLGFGSAGGGQRGQSSHRCSPQKKQKKSLAFYRGTAEGKDAQIIGEVTAEFNGVAMQTVVGGKRIIARPIGDPVPRIC